MFFFKRLNLPLILIFLTLLTTSFDIFLDFKIAGFTIRATQATLIALIFLSFIQLFRTNKIQIPLGFPALLLWTFFMILFIPNTNFLSRNILYVIWLILSILGIYAFVQTINTKERLFLVMRFYLFSYLFVSLFGLLQFIAGLAGISLLTAQWFFSGRLARLNGFSYEPSYFATYLITGFILIAYLREKKSFLLSKRSWSIYYYTVFITLILSTSRMGWLLCIIWFCKPILPFLRYLSTGYINLFYLKKMFLKTIIPISFLIAGAVVLIFMFDIHFFIMGLGIINNSSFSSQTRWNEFMDLLTIFINSPFIGYSLGGLSSAIADLYNITITSNEEAKRFEGSGVFAQILAASGIFGIIPFIVYLYELIIKPIKLSQKMTDEETRYLLIGMVVSLIFLFAILQFNSTVLRSYLWAHIGLLCSCYAVAKKGLRLPENSFITQESIYR